MENKQTKENKALIDRLNGRLTTVDIMGHIFYVDFPMRMLRPKDDFLSKGIPFDSIKGHYNSKTQQYEIPYNAITHEFIEIKYDAVNELSNEVTLISFPSPAVMDPVGYARTMGEDLTMLLRQTPQRAHFIAEKLTGKRDWLSKKIEESRQLLGEKPIGTKRKGKKI